MNDDYLWDRSGKPDPDVARLEETLGRLRSRRPAPDFSSRVIRFPQRPRRLWMRFAAAAAVLIVIASAAWLALFELRPSWEVARLTGSPRIGSQAVAGVSRLSRGEWLETDAESSARVAVGAIGQVQVDPNTRVRLIETRANLYRMALQRGRIHATIWAPPRLFFVDTPSVKVVDLGCAYTLEVDDAGNGLVRVSVGWVGFEAGGRESFIPAEAACRTWKNRGPGVPYYLDASDALIDALARFEAGHDGLDGVLAEARKRDALTLWHLLPRVSDADRPRLYDRLAALVPPPEGVSRETTLRLDRKALDLYWDALGLGDTSWWRLWKQPWK